MDILNKLKNFFRTKSSDTLTLDDASGWRPFGVGTSTNYGDAVFECCDLYGLYFTKAKFPVYSKDSRGMVERSDTHEFSEALTNMPFTNFTLFKQLLGAYYGIYGEAFIYIKRGSKGQILYADAIHPAIVMRKKDKRGVVIGYNVLQNTGDMKFIERDDMLDLRYPNPFDATTGRPINANISPVINVAALQVRYLEKFYQEGGFLGATFSTSQQMTRDSFRRAVDMLKQKYQGLEGAYKIAVFDSGLAPVKTAYSLKEIDNVSQMKAITEKIYKAYKVPDILIGRGEGVTQANGYISDLVFLSTVIDPLLNVIDDEMTHYVKRHYGPQYYVKHDRLAPKDQQSALEFYKTMFGMGALTINEIRALEGLNKFDYELADVPLVNLGGAMIRIDRSVQISKEETPTDTQQDVNKTLKLKTLDQQWQQFERRHTYALRGIYRSLGRYLDGQEERIMQALKDNLAVQDAFDLDKEDIALQELLEIELMEIFTYGYEYAGYTSLALSDGAYTDYFQTLAPIYGNSNKKLLDDLINVVNSGGDINSKVTNLFNSYRNGYYKSLATTLTTVGMNQGILHSMRTAGITHKVWVSARDERVRDTIDGENHVIMDGVVTQLEDSFEVPSRSGVDLMLYPGDPSGSPENIINCRCTITAYKNEI